MLSDFLRHRISTTASRRAHIVPYYAVLTTTFQHGLGIKWNKKTEIIKYRSFWAIISILGKRINLMLPAFEPVNIPTQITCVHTTTQSKHAIHFAAEASLILLSPDTFKHHWYYWIGERIRTSGQENVSFLFSMSSLGPWQGTDECATADRWTKNAMLSVFYWLSRVFAFQRPYAAPKHAKTNPLTNRKVWRKPSRRQLTAAFIGNVPRDPVDRVIWCNRQITVLRMGNTQF